MKTVNKATIIFSLILLSALTFNNTSYGLNVNLYGRSGAEVGPNGHVTICPGLSFNKCATVHITWQDIKDWLSTKNPFGVSVSEEKTGQIYQVQVRFIDDSIIDNITEQTDNLDVVADDAFQFFIQN